MSNELDQTTGLPPLPEGQWWEVRKCVVLTPDLYYPHDLTDGYEVIVATKKTTPPTTKPGKRWWNSPAFVPEETKDVVLYRNQITDPALYAASMRPSFGGFYRHKTGKEVITAADVLKAARDIIDRMEAVAAHKAREAESAKLLGAYPPNKL